MIEFYRDTHRIKSQPYNYLYDLIRQIDGLVQLYADKAYNVSALDCNRPKQKNWLEKIQNYCNGKVPLFMNAYYGYAVEEMVNQELTAQYSSARNGYRVLLQVTHGSTRPDIVITDRGNNEVAWLDITSENSAGHIWNKEGNGWSTSGFVAELLYPTFDVTKLRNSDDIGIGVRASTLSVSRKASIHQNHLREHPIAKLNIALSDFARAYSESKSAVASRIARAFDCSFTERKKHPAIKSMLKKYMEIYLNSNYIALVRSILNDYYSNDRQDLALAMCFISDSYDQEQENQRMFDYLDDWDEDILA